ncbi:MAG: hypothetical protein JNM24_03825 [Bdellovibrionaceae bacterium]|nr:hypothetical protein [Pseudobdellovibrionaceae bacterium]
MKLFISIFLTISVSYAQLRTPQSIWGSLERVSPLNDKNYFEVMDNHAKKLGKITKTKQIDSKKLKQVKLFKFKSTLRSYAYGKKFYVPKRVNINDPLAEGLNKSVPAYIPPSQSEAEVMKFFGDKMIQNWLSSPAVKNSSFGKAASTVEQAMKVEASISGPPAAFGSGEKTIDHKFSFQYQALQSQAKVEYQGWGRAHFIHDSRIGQTALELSEKIFKNKDLVFNHTKNTIENRSFVGVRWAW